MVWAAVIIRQLREWSNGMRIPSPWEQVQEIYAVLMTTAWQDGEEDLALAAHGATVAAIYAIECEKNIKER